MKKEKLPIIVSGFKESVVDVQEKDDRLIITGLAVPFNKVSTNGVMYNKESLIETLDIWRECPVMYNHMIEGDALPIGKILEMNHKDDGLYYKVEIDKKEEKICGKIRDGYLKKVSIHILPKDVSVRSGYQEAIVGRPLEFSVVPVPGFMETDMAAYVEKLKLNKIGDDNNMVKSKTSSIKEKQGLKKKLREKIDEKLSKNNSIKSTTSEKFELRKFKEALDKKFASKEDVNKILSLMEEYMEKDDNSDIIEDVKDHEDALGQSAEILEIILNRLDRIEEIVSKNEEPEESEEEIEETEEPEEEMTDVPEEELEEKKKSEDSLKEGKEGKKENVGDEPKGDEPKGDEPKGDEPKGDEPKGDELEKEEKTIKEHVNISFNNLERNDFNKNVLHLN